MRPIPSPPAAESPFWREKASDEPENQPRKADLGRARAPSAKMLDSSEEMHREGGRAGKAQCVCVCVCVLVTQSCQTLCRPMYCGLPGSSARGILQARILGWVATPFSRGIFLTQGKNPGLLH